ncbi:hypothetical protein F7Q99_36650 [Streptomyces kaniharaensis]|uniref:Uncharacterized protein n=1 Tax=Streptomyces kaniharaensis TaxID=212423 RepID=A0A6N7L1P4_9ACTN|nr:hypothetical protein [Streptomyces kaniharaensis]MQS17571.1 hypothetical protein [Streptomyces kaniharaensis]
MTSVADYGRRHGACWAANRTIALGLALHEKTVAAALREVEGELVLSEHHAPTGTLARRVRPVAEDELAVTVSAVARNCLSGHRFKVYCAISVRSDLGQAVSAAQLAEACGMTPEGARTTARDLVADGWVSRVGSRGGAFKYTVHPAQLSGVAVQLGLFPQPRQSARPDAVVGLEDVVGEWVCAGQLALFGDGSVEETPLDSAPETPLDRLPETPLAAAPLTGHSQQARVNRHLSVVGCCSRVAETLVTRDAGAREGGPLRPGPGVVGASVGPLRGEQPKIAAATVPVVLGGGCPGVARSPRSAGSVFGLPDALRVALTPVDDLWQRLNGTSTREFVAGRVWAELRRIAMWSGREAAPEVLAGRLSRRLDRQQGSALVTDPVGWLLSRGLPQEQVCARTSCDDGIRLDTGALCDTCEMRLADRRATRSAVVAQALAGMPGADYADRQGAIEERLREHAFVKAEQQMTARRRAEEQRFRDEADRPVREAAAAAAEEERVAVPCADCGAERSAGLCGICWCRREARAAITEAVNAALTTVDLRDRDAVNALTRQVRDGMRTAMLAARPARELGLDAHAVANSDMLAAKNRATDYRQEALALLAQSPEAEQEAKQASDAVRRAGHRYRSTEDLRDAVTAAAHEARWHTAHHLYGQRHRAVEQLRERTRALRQPQEGGTVSRYEAALATVTAFGGTA